MKTNSVALPDLRAKNIPLRDFFTCWRRDWRKAYSMLELAGYETNQVTVSGRFRWG